MGNVLVIVEQWAGELRKGSLAAITAGKKTAAALGSECLLLVMGKGLDGAKFDKYGAKVLLANSDALHHYLAESNAAVAADVAKAKNASFIVATATAFGKDLMPRLAAKLGAGMVSDITGVNVEGGKLLFNRPMWAGSVDGAVEVLTPVVCATVRQTAFDPAAEAGSAGVEAVAVNVDLGALKTKWVAFDETKSDRPELSEAAIVVSGGRGLKDAAGFKQIEPLADLFNAAIGASRAAVDGGFCPNDLQVGQTGKIVAPKIYFALGISGAIQHVAGMKDSKVIVAVNKDPEAPIFQVADYGLVADVFKVLPDMLTGLKKAMGK